MGPILAASPWWAPILQTAIGGAIGAGGAIAGGAFGSWFNWQHERQAIAAALAGEVEAEISVAEFRQFRPIIESCLESTKAQGKLVYLRFSIDDHPFPVFEQNVSKIGFLPEDLARQVTEFYSYARSSVQDLRILYSQDLDNWSLPAVLPPARSFEGARKHSFRGKLFLLFVIPVALWLSVNWCADCIFAQSD